MLKKAQTIATTMIHIFALCFTLFYRIIHSKSVSCHKNLRISVVTQTELCGQVLLLSSTREQNISNVSCKYDLYEGDFKAG